MPDDRSDNLDSKGNLRDKRAGGPSAEHLPQPRGTAAVKFLQRFRPNGPWALTAIDPDDNRIATRTFTDGEEARRFIAKYNDAGDNLYYSINSIKRALSTKANKHDIACVEYLQVDADPGSDETTEEFKAQLRPRIAAYSQKPTFVIDSGNGIQLLWRLQKAVEITSNEVIKDIEARNHALALAFKAAPITRNIDRVFRLPGTINFPTRKKREIGRTKCLAKLLEYNKVTYSVFEFPPYRRPPTPTRTQTRTTTPTELPANLRTLLLADGSGGYPSRSELLFAFLTGAIRAGLPDSEIITACLDDRYRRKGVYQHIAENGGRQCAERQLQRAHEKIDKSRTDNVGHAWDDPDVSILDDRRGELPKFPLDTLEPKELQEWVTRNASSTGTTVDHVAVPLLGVAASLIGGSRSGRAAAFAQPATLWTFLIGYSGTGKTPGLDASRKPLATLEDRRAPHVALLKRKHDERIARAEAATKKWKRDLEEAMKAASRAPRKPPDAEDPGQFVEPRLYTTDITVERMAMLLQARPQSMLLLTDELAGWLHNMRRYTGGDDTQFWLMAWDGKPYSVERVGRPSFKLARLLVGVVGGLQPGKLRDAFKADDGFYARPLYAWLNMPTYSPLGAAPASEDEMVDAFDRLDRLARQESTCIDLSVQALAKFERLRKAVHQKLPSFDGREREWFAKVSAQVLRLACTLAYLRWAFATEEGTAEPTEIKLQNVMAAARLVLGYFWPHARAVLRQIGLTERHADARRILRWLAAKRCTEVSREDIRRNALGRSRDADQTQILLDQLCKAGWLRPESRFTGGRPSVRYEVNPKLHEIGQQ
jgi:Protein of unknown function (DUF3987)